MIEQSNVPKIKAFHHWSPDSVRRVCIANHLYTKGNSKEYDRMLQMTYSEATNEMIWYVAQDIYEHSSGQTITNIMYILKNYAVVTTYELNGRDDI